MVACITVEVKAFAYERNLLGRAFTSFPYAKENPFTSEQELRNYCPGMSSVLTLTSYWSIGNLLFNCPRQRSMIAFSALCCYWGGTGTSRPLHLLRKMLCTHSATTSRIGNSVRPRSPGARAEKV